MTQSNVRVFRQCPRNRRIRCHRIRADESVPTPPLVCRGGRRSLWPLPRCRCSPHKSAGLTAFADLSGLALMLVAGWNRVEQCSVTTGAGAQFLGADGPRVLAVGVSTKVLGPITIYFCIARFPISLSLTSFFSSMRCPSLRPWPGGPICGERGEKPFRTAKFSDAAGMVDFSLRLHRVSAPVCGAEIVALYNVYYNRLYQLENVLLLAVLMLAAWTSSGGWRRLYLHFLRGWRCCTASVREPWSWAVENGQILFGKPV